MRRFPMHRTVRFNVINQTLVNTAHRRRCNFMLGYKKLTTKRQDVLDLGLYDIPKIPKEGMVI